MHKTWPYVVIKRPDGRDAARFVCARCEAHAELPLVRGAGKGVINGEATAHRAAQAGWEVTPRRAECPRCVADKARRGKGERPGPKPHQFSPTRFATAHPEKEAAMADVKPRDATQQERLKIRAILDKHFDDDAGCWLDGYSDQKAGEEAGVPWAIVTRIREAAYGPIRVDPEVAGLRAELMQIGRELATLTEKHGAAAKRLEALVAKRAA